jgi:predicted DsbA family dithiol-disulfide isomerase
MRVRAWPLEWVNGAPLDPDLAAREIAALREHVAPDLFAGFDAATFPRTSMPAFGLAAAAYAVDDLTGETVSLALRDALFEHGEDVSDDGVLRAIARPFGIEPFDSNRTESAVRTDWERGKARAVQGSPHFFVGDRGWFCPSLDITHVGERFDIQIADEAMREFYAAAVGS